MLTIRRLAEVALSDAVFFVQPSASGHVVASSRDGRVSLLAPDLTLVGQFDFGRRPNDVSISAAGDFLAICAGDSLSLLRGNDGREQYRVAVGQACIGSFNKDGDLIWTIHSEDDENITVELRDVRDGRILRHTTFAVPSPGVSCSFHRHPGSGGVAIWAAAGQDGQWIFWAHDSGEAIVIAQAEGISQCTPPCFNADGTAFLIATLNSLQRWSFPKVTCLGAITEWPWSDTEEDSVGTSAAWVGTHRALVTTNENRLYIVDLEKARVVGEAVIDGHPLRPIGELYPRLKHETGLTTDLELLVPMSNNRLLSIHKDRETSRVVLSDVTALV